MAQIDQLTSDLDPEGAGQLFYQLADHYYHSGRWAWRQRRFESLIQRYPQHPLSPWRCGGWCNTTPAARRRGGWGTTFRSKRSGGERAVALGQQIEQTRFEWFAQPAVRFPLAAAYRGLGQARQAERLYQSQGRTAAGTPGGPAPRPSCSWPIPRAGRRSRCWPA